jgi:hypothetical protein
VAEARTRLLAAADALGLRPSHDEEPAELV